MSTAPTLIKPDLDCTADQRPRLPADRCYWAVIDALAGRSAGTTSTRRDRAWRPGVIPPGLLVDLAEQVPVAVEELHAVIAQTADGRIVICAIAIAELQDQLSCYSSCPASLIPESLPPALESAVDPGMFNLLVGPFEPKSMRRARAIRHTAAMAVLLVAAGLIALGAIRRTRHWAHLSELASAATVATISEVSPIAHTAAELATELNRARRLADVDLSVRRAPDAAASLASLLAIWPPTEPQQTKPQSVSVGADGLSVALLVAGDPSRFLAAVKSPPGWSMDEPRLAAVDTHTRVTLRFRRESSRSARPEGEQP